MSIIDIIDGLCDVVTERAPRFSACFGLAFASCLFVFWLVPGFLNKILVSVILLAVGSLIGLIWERCAPKDNE